MSAYWRVSMMVPAFRMARQLYRDTHGPMAMHRFFRDNHMVKIFRAWPSAANSELQKSFDEVCKRHWEGFSKDMNNSFGVRIERDRDRRDSIWPSWEANSERQKLFNAICKRHWKDFEKDMEDTFSVRIARDQDRQNRRDCTDKVTGVKTEPVKADSPAPSEAGQGFEVALDLSGFAPEEISVRIIGNDILRVEARHKAEQADGSRVLRSYTREFLLPADVDLDALKSNLDAQGMLNLKAPDRDLPPERAVHIDVATAGEKSSEPTEEASADEDMKVSHAEEADSSTAEKPEDKK
ncbi:uncharacterized protein LOC119727425 [Patiria miniata]|uniref:SHSP domain-containing protein n=1 Tax=Patiria miniata TaxID=46514 RepID=A0A913ZVY0_PATMI|nr:uncharacterized protein LOC119727425 [Patiria miniata]